MHDSQRSFNFWLGNGILAFAMLLLLFMGSLWSAMGLWAMGLWVGVVAVGVYILMKDKDESPMSPD